MAHKSTVYKAELIVSDMDRSYYAPHNLVLAQHPSEPDRRLVARLVVFALFAEERLEFGRGLGNSEDPDLWRRDLTGSIEQWFELGQPDDSSIRKACGRAQQVIVVNYGGNAAEAWWDKNRASLMRSKNLTVLDLDPTVLNQGNQLLERTMRLSATLQEGELQLSNATQTIVFSPRTRLLAEKVAATKFG